MTNRDLPHMFSSGQKLNFLCILFLTSCLILGAGCTKEGPMGPAGPPGPTNEDLTNPAIQPRIIATVPANGSTGPFTQLYQPGFYYYYYYPGRPHIILQFNKLMVVPSPPIYRLWFNPIYRPYRVNWYSGQFTNYVYISLTDSLSNRTVNYRVGQTYTTTIDSGMVDVNGNSTAQRYTFSYAPEPYFRVLTFSPADGSVDVSPLSTSAVGISFNSPVAYRIRSSIHILPLLPGAWSLSSDSLTLTYNIHQRFPYGVSYTVSVDQGAQDSYGNTIFKEFHSSFTVQDFGVSGSSPSEGSYDVVPSGPIYLNFNGEVDKASASQAFTVTPQLNGMLTVYSDELVFTPTYAFDPNTAYVITMSTALKAADSTHLGSPFTLHFRTKRFTLQNTYPSDGQSGVGTSEVINLYFNSIPDTASLRLALSVTPHTSFSPSLDGNRLVYNLFPAGGLIFDTTYTITLSTAARATNGDTLVDPYSFSFTTGASATKR